MCAEKRDDFHKDHRRQYLHPGTLLEDVGLHVRSHMENLILT